MLSILLVEDEKLELETLRDYINWERLGVTKVYTARNGRSALEIIEEQEPDIMITDIQMPVMDGVTLTKRLREEGYNIKIVFLTGYDDFDYVKSAFQVEAVDYILKPFLAEEVETLILRIGADVMKENARQETKRLAERRLIEEACLQEESIPVLLDEEKGFGILAIYAKYNKALLEILKKRAEIRHVFYAKELELYVVVLRGYVSVLDAAIRINKQFLEKNTVVYCKECFSQTELAGATAMLHRLGEVVFYERPGQIFEAAALSKRLLQTEEKKSVSITALYEAREVLCRSLAGGLMEEAKAALTVCKKELYQLPKKICCKEAYALYLSINNQLIMSDLKLTEYMEPFEQFFCFEEIEECLDGYFDQVLSWQTKQKEDPNYYAVAWVKEYLAQNYGGVCSVEEMAEGIHLSPNYLRSLFKAGTGMTILEYVTDYRLDKACRLLRDKSLKIKDIGLQVGYENISYFSQVFVKRHGVTPNEYRKMV